MWHRAQYLVMVYECGSCKNVITISTGYGSKIQVAVAVEQLENYKGQQNSPTPTHLEPHQLQRNPNCKNNSAETRRTKFSRNDQCLKNKAEINKYYNNNVLCLQSKLEATGIVCNMQYASGTILMY